MFCRTQQHIVLCRVALAVSLAFGVSACHDDSFAAHRAEAAQFQQKGELQAAVISLKNAIEAKPGDADTRLQLALVYIDTGDAVSAEKETRFAIERGLPQQQSLSVLGRSLLMQGQYQKALDETAPASAQKEPVLMCVRADAMLALGQREPAGVLYAQVLQAHPDYPAALIGMGRLAFLAGDAVAARKYVDLALKASARNTDALLFKGDLLRAQDQTEQALATYDQVLAISPAHRSAHIEKAYIDISLARFEAAQAEVDQAKATTPTSLLVAYTQTLLDYSQGNNSAAQESIQKVLRVAPDHMPSVLLAGAISLNIGSLHQAEHHLRHYLENQPDNLYARKMLATTLLRSGHSPAALAVLAPALKREERDVALLALAGESSMQSRNFNQAATYFEQASALAPHVAGLRTSLALSKLGKGQQSQAIEDLRAAVKLDASSQRAGITLVRTELALGNVDNAYAAVLALEKAQPANPAVQDVKGMVQLARHEAGPAAASFERALVLQPSYYPAAANLSRQALDARQIVAATNYLQRFLDKNPTSVEAMTALASLASGENQEPLATTWLERARAADPDGVAPAVNLIGQYLLIGKKDKALDLAGHLLVVHPDNPDLLDLLGKSQLANEDREGALASYKKLAVMLPRSAEVQMQLAALQLLLQRPAEAEDHLKAALATQPDFPAAQLALAELHVRKGWFQLAQQVAAQMQAKHPKASAGYQLEADVLMAQSKPALALPLFERAAALNNSAELTIKMADALRADGKRDMGERRLTQWLQQHPNDLRIKLFQAETALADRRFTQAALQLEAIVAQFPDNTVALNNLALAYQQNHDSRARKTAERAYELAKNAPVVMDTLGWILIEDGQIEHGLNLLRQASELAPRARDIRYHLAFGLAAGGDKQGARKELQTLVAGNMQFAQADDTRALLKRLD